MASCSIWDEPVAQQELLCYIALPALTEQEEGMNPHKSCSEQHRYLGCSDVLGAPYDGSCWMKLATIKQIIFLLIWSQL